MVAKAASKAPAPKAAAGSHAAQKGAAGHHGPPKAAAGSHASPAVKKVAAEKGEKVERPTKPDEDKYKSDLATAEKELEEAKKKVAEIREKLSLMLPPRSGPDSHGHGPSPIQQRQAPLRAELGKIREQQAAFKQSRQKIHDQIKHIDASLKTKLAEQKAARAKIPYRSVEDIDALIAKLDKAVESGTMKLVDERKALADISQLRKNRKNLAALDSGKDLVDHDKAKIADLKALLGEDPEQKSLSDRYTEIIAELDAIKAEQDAVYKNLASLREEQNKLRKDEQDKWHAKKALEDAFWTANKAFRAYEKAANEARREKFRSEREAKDKEYKRNAAAAKMEEASEPAYAAEILTCESLIGHFDPQSAEAHAAKTKGSLLKDQGLRATATRVVDALPKGTKLVKKEEDYFVGGKGKKGKKGANKGTSSPITPTTPTHDDKGKFQLNHGILIELGKVDVRAPVGWDDVPGCVEKLRARLAFYKENSDRVTKENIAKAQKEIDRLDGKTPEKAEVHAPADTAVHDDESIIEKEMPEETPLPVPSHAVPVAPTQEAGSDPNMQGAAEW